MNFQTISGRIFIIILIDFSCGNIMKSDNGGDVRYDSNYSTWDSARSSLYVISDMQRMSIILTAGTKIRPLEFRSFLEIL